MVLFFAALISSVLGLRLAGFIVTLEFHTKEHPDYNRQPGCWVSNSSERVKNNFGIFNVRVDRALRYATLPRAGGSDAVAAGEGLFCTVDPAFWSKPDSLLRSFLATLPEGEFRTWV